jgi:copper chaperone CopZ
MKHTYQINGMSCQGCSKKVALALNGIKVNLP